MHVRRAGLRATRNHKPVSIEARVNGVGAALHHDQLAGRGARLAPVGVAVLEELINIAVIERLSEFRRHVGERSRHSQELR